MQQQQQKLIPSTTKNVTFAVLEKKNFIVVV